MGLCSVMMAGRHLVRMMNNMTIVITMAGQGLRFKNAGYAEPKYMIEAHGEPLFYWAIVTLRGVTAVRYVFVVRREDGATAFIKKQCARLGIGHYEVLEIDRMTAGQAETAILAKPYWCADAAMLIYNIDTFVEPYQIRNEQFKGDGFIPCFSAPGEHWSFVRLGAEGRAAEVREKRRVSNHCTLGAYYFKTASLYERLYAEHYLDAKSNTEAGERYIAPLYNRLIGQGGNVYISTVPGEKVHVLGTPAEVKAFLAGSRPSLPM